MKRDDDPGFFEKVSHTYKRALGAAAAAGAAGAAAWWGRTLMSSVPEGTATAATGYAGYLAAVKDKFLQHKHLMNELGEAQRYIYDVERWIAAMTGKFCQDNVRRILADAKAHINQLLHQPGGHFIAGIEKYDAELAAMIREGHAAVDGNEDTYNRWMKNLYHWGTNYWWSDYYRADLAAHMVKLIEAVESGIMATLIKDTTCPPLPPTYTVVLNPKLQTNFDRLLKKIEIRDQGKSDFSTPIPPKLHKKRAKRTALGGIKSSRRKRTPSYKKSASNQSRSRSKRH